MPKLDKVMACFLEALRLFRMSTQSWFKINDTLSAQLLDP
jgi:hypothetical protein